MDRSICVLAATAIAIGRLPGEPPAILPHRRGWLSRIAGLRVRRPLADPRLEILRAISASLTRGDAAGRRVLVAAAMQAGWSRGDLCRVFPDTPIFADNAGEGA